MNEKHEEARGLGKLWESFSFPNPDHKRNTQLEKAAAAVEFYQDIITGRLHPTSDSALQREFALGLTPMPFKTFTELRKEAELRFSNYSNRLDDLLEGRDPEATDEFIKDKDTPLALIWNSIPHKESSVVTDGVEIHIKKSLGKNEEGSTSPTVTVKIADTFGDSETYILDSVGLLSASIRTLTPKINFNSYTDKDGLFDNTGCSFGIANFVTDLFRPRTR